MDARPTLTLTRRQLQVRRMRADGLPVIQIARDLGITRQRVYAILGQIKRAEARSR